MLALPAFAAALPAHLDKVPADPFAIHGGASQLTRVEGAPISGKTVTGTGTFENTTTGTVTLTFTEVKAGGVFNCTSAGQAAGTVKTTELTFHLVMLGTEEPGILLTGGPTPSPGAKEHFATFNCGIFVGTIVVEGKGILGTILEPDCGDPASNIASLDFSGAAGKQDHKTYTDDEYTLTSSLNGGPFLESAMDAEATITFGGGAKHSIICTHEEED